MKVKICGISRLEDALYAANLGADAIGFILYPKSKRYIKPDDVKNIIKKLPPFIIKVGVFVNENYEYVNKVATDTGLNLVQLHGDETPEYLSKIMCPVIKAFRISNSFKFNYIERYKDCYYLLDAYDSGSYGGTGKRFKWDIIPENLKNKIILAGGITQEDLEFIENEISPYAIDVSSSIELEPGKKDLVKMTSFFSRLKKIRGL